MVSTEGLKFGTSGLRGLVVDLVGEPAYRHALAYARYLLGNGTIGAGGAILVGRDLRSSSPEIAGNCIAAIEASGLAAVDCGEVPTPALALAALERGLPAIMVTGSHIPDDRNGLKFYRPDGEISKADEAGILAALATIGGTGAAAAPAERVVDRSAVIAYLERFAHFFGPDALGGMTVGVYQHSSVSRDVLVRILENAGARTEALGRADRFIPVDTEALRAEDVALAAGWASSGRFDAIVSTDGDADRPLVADETGTFIRGDLVGLLTAIHLDADAIVTPVTSNSAIERAGRVWRTRVGSPFVIAGMDEALAAGARRVVGFEANGGVLLGSHVERDGRTLPALATRDAVLPILSVLALAKARGIAVSALVASLNATATAAHRLQEVPGEKSRALLERLATEDGRRAYFADVGQVASVSTTDGVRFTLESGEVVHYRASGNAPELRCYVEAASQERADALLTWGLGAARQAVEAGG